MRQIVGGTGRTVVQKSWILLKNYQNTASRGILIPNLVGALDHAFNI
jgi:hypothetical protein